MDLHRALRRAPRLALAAVVTAHLSFAVSCRRAADSCDACQRETCVGIRFTVAFEDGTEKRLCCPRCASHVVSQAGGLSQVIRLEARDFESGAAVDARRAVYVDGSDVQPCSAPGTRPGEHGCCDVLAMDRCRPSLLAFATREGAGAFARSHGGAVKAFDQLGFGGGAP
jgi:hypothetical protein